MAGRGIVAAMISGTKRGLLLLQQAGPGYRSQRRRDRDRVAPGVPGPIQSLGVFIDHRHYCTATALRHPACGSRVWEATAWIPQPDDPGCRQRAGYLDDRALGDLIFVLALPPPVIAAYAYSDTNMVLRVW